MATGVDELVLFALERNGSLSLWAWDRGTWSWAPTGAVQLPQLGLAVVHAGGFVASAQAYVWSESGGSADGDGVKVSSSPG